ncbi:hypothetical protein Bbelb_315740 [Branchiostoma belcheri]|nr:hypothetical protein Bbelb_315740 [Branchiostoma belcheri]
MSNRGQSDDAIHPTGCELLRFAYKCVQSPCDVSPRSKEATSLCLAARWKQVASSVERRRLLTAIFRIPSLFFGACSSSKVFLLPRRRHVGGKSSCHQWHRCLLPSRALIGWMHVVDSIARVNTWKPLIKRVQRTVPNRLDKVVSLALAALNCEDGTQRVSSESAHDLADGTKWRVITTPHSVKIVTVSLILGDRQKTKVIDVDVLVSAPVSHSGHSHDFAPDHSPTKNITAARQWFGLEVTASGLQEV